MQLNKHRSHKKTLIIILIVFFVFTAVCLAVYRYTQMNTATKAAIPEKTDQVNLQPATKEEINLGNQQKGNTVNPQVNDSPVDSGRIDVDFTALNQNATTVQIRSLIIQTVSGVCNLTITNGSKSKTYSASTQVFANSTTCAGFDIPVSDLGNGKWAVSLIITATDNKTGTASTTIQVGS